MLGPDGRYSRIDGTLGVSAQARLMNLYDERLTTVD
jgi:hypothetical protein